MTEVLVEVTDIKSDIRQIGPREKHFINIQERQQQIQEAIAAGINISGEALSKASNSHGWRVSEFAIRFAISLTAEASVIVARVGGEASFEVNVTLTRGPDQ